MSATTRAKQSVTTSSGQNTTHTFLVSLEEQQIKLWLENDELRVNAPKEALTPTLIDEMRSRKAEILAFLQQRTATNGQASAIQPVPRDEKLPLSFAQQRLWFLTQLEGASATYNIPLALRMEGTLDIEVLERSLAEIVRRHESLRTTFPLVEGQAQQRIHPALPARLPLVSLDTLPTDTQESEVQRLAREEATHPFDLTTGPLWRIKLLRLTEAQYVLLLTMHHIVTDGWSIDVFLRELSILYAAYSQKKPSPLPALDIHYADFTIWQRQWLRGDVLEQQLAYWQKQLANAPYVLNLPTDQPRPATQSYRGDHSAFVLPASLSAQLKQLSQHLGVTLFMTLQAALAVLLARYSGQEEILIGTPVANRQRRELEPIIGFFANTLVLRNDLTGNPTFETLLDRVRQTALYAYQHQDFPFEALVEALQPERTTSHSPLFQVLFTLQSNSQTPFELPGVTTTLLDVSFPVSKFDLSLNMQENDDQLLGWWEYSTDLFNAATIERMTGHLETLLQGIVTNPNASMSQLPLLTTTERRQILVEWNATTTAYPRSKAINQLFEEQVMRTPQAIAVSFEETQLTYAELNSRANQLAHHLKTLGVVAESCVGICLERSIEMIVGLLGILKAGGAYVPLDPAYPHERLAFMVEDTAISVLITQQKLSLTFLPDVKLVCLDSAGEMLARRSSENVMSAVAADSLAYVMYTSGSTGTPKGVAINHRNVVRLVQNTNFAQLTAQEVFLQLAPISFDASTLEIWGALLNGAKLVVMPAGHTSLDELGRVIRQHQITILWLTAGLFHLMVDERVEDLRPLRQLLAGGDILSVSHVQKAFANLPHCQLINGYGPTENTTFTCCFPIKEIEQHRTSIPIGRPVANTQVYILDRELQPVPVGIVGELYTGGDGVARGYYNQPELTDEKFIQNPFGEGRLYHTGDQTRWLPDGNIEFVGRVDDQVKIRGFRIELGEIEALLAQHESIQDAVIVVREEAGDKHLVAYVTGEKGRSNHDVTLSELRSYLKQKLPDYLIPSAYVHLDAMPLTPNGKIDRIALPAPTPQVASASAHIVPQTGVERQIAEVWQTVLEVDKVGTQDNFFELGGHSLLLIQVHQRLQEAMEEELAVIDLFTYPTIQALANHLNRREVNATLDVQQDTGQKERRRKRKAKISQRKRIRKDNRYG